MRWEQMRGMEVGKFRRLIGVKPAQALAMSVHELFSQIWVIRYCLAAHDVGAWVAYPYAQLFGDAVRRLALLDAGITGITLPDALPTAPEKA